MPFHQLITFLIVLILHLHPEKNILFDLFIQVRTNLYSIIFH